MYEHVNTSSDIFIFSRNREFILGKWKSVALCLFKGYGIGCSFTARSILPMREYKNFIEQSHDKNDTKRTTHYDIDKISNDTSSRSSPTCH